MKMRQRVKPWISHAKGTWDASMLWAEYRGHLRATCSVESSFAKQISLVFPLGQAQPLPRFILVNHLGGSELVGCLVLRQGDGLMLHVARCKSSMTILGTHPACRTALFSSPAHCSLLAVSPLGCLGAGLELLAFLYSQFTLLGPGTNGAATEASSSQRNVLFCHCRRDELVTRGLQSQGAMEPLF